MGDNKVIDGEFIRKLGKSISRSADSELPPGKNDAARAQDMMGEAGQGGGMTVVLGFFFASAYVEGAWQDKQEFADDLDQGAQQVAKTWHTMNEHWVDPSGVGR